MSQIKGLLMAIIMMAMNFQESKNSGGVIAQMCYCSMPVRSLWIRAIGTFLFHGHGFNPWKLVSLCSSGLSF